MAKFEWNLCEADDVIKRETSTRRVQMATDVDITQQ